MKRHLIRTLGRLLVAISLLLPSIAAAAPRQAAKLSFQYRQSEHKVVGDAQPLFGHYLGTGDGVASGALEGTIGWDLYEDQSRDDFHPAHFHGFVERPDGRHAFQILGVYTPIGSEKATMPGGHETYRYWALSGTISFDEATVLGVRQALVTGTVDAALGALDQVVWVEPTKEAR